MNTPRSESRLPAGLTTTPTNSLISIDSDQISVDASPITCPYIDHGAHYVGIEVRETSPLFTIRRVSLTASAGRSRSSRLRMSGSTGAGWAGDSRKGGTDPTCGRGSARDVPAIWARAR